MALRLTEQPEIKHFSPIYDEHHLFWPEREYDKRDEASLRYRFRELGCLKVRVDFLVHMALYQVMEPPRQPSPGEMEFMIRRHRLRRCACGRSWRKRRVVDLLGARADHPEIVEMSCFWVPVDVTVLMMMRWHYRQPEPLRQKVFDLIADRHREGKCACATRLHSSQCRVPAKRLLVAAG